MDISKLSVILTGSASGLTAMFSGAKSDLNSFTSSFKSAAGAITGIGAAIGAGAAVAGIVSLTKNTFDTIDANAKLSDSLGISTEALTRLQYAGSYAGASNEALTTGITKMLKNLNEAASGSGAAADALQALGLNAKELQSIPTDEAVGKIADALNGMSNAGQRAAFAQEIFGKGAVDLLPLLAEGSEGLKKWGEESDKLGYTMNRVDAAKVEQANDAITKIGNVIQGVMNKLAVELAPFIETAATKFADLATSGRGAAMYIVDGFEWVLRAVAKVADFLQLNDVAWYGLKEVAIIALAEVIDALDATGKAIVEVINKIPGVHLAWSETLSLVSADLKKQASDADIQMQKSWQSFKNGDNEKAVTNFFDKIREASTKTATETAKTRQHIGGLAIDSVKATNEVAKALDSLQKKLDQYRMTAGEKAADDIKRLGGNEGDQDKAKSLQDQLDSLDRAKELQKDLANQAKQLWEETRTPLEKYNDELNRLDDLLNEGAIDETTYARAAAKANDDFNKSKKKNKGDEAAQLITAGSQDAAEFVAKINAQNDKSDLQDKLLSTNEKTTDYTKQIAENSKKWGSVTYAVADF